MILGELPLFHGEPEEIRRLTEESKMLIEINTRIEKGRHTPFFSKKYSGYKSPNVSDDIRADKLSITVANNDAVYFDSKMALEKYQSMFVVLRNCGERPVIKFVCKQLLIDDIESVFYSDNCEVNPGETVGVVVAFPDCIWKQIAEKSIRVQLIYEMYNTIDQIFHMTIEAEMYCEEDTGIVISEDISKCIGEETDMSR